MFPVLLPVLLACGGAEGVDQAVSRGASTVSEPAPPSTTGPVPAATREPADATMKLVFRDKVVTVHADDTYSVADATGTAILERLTFEELERADRQVATDVFRALTMPGGPSAINEVAVEPPLRPAR